MTLARVGEIVEFYGNEVALLIGGDLYRGENLARQSCTVPCRGRRLSLRSASVVPDPGGHADQSSRACASVSSTASSSMMPAAIAPCTAAALSAPPAAAITRRAAAQVVERQRHRVKRFGHHRIAVGVEVPAEHFADRPCGDDLAHRLLVEVAGLDEQRVGTDDTDRDHHHVGVAGSLECGGHRLGLEEVGGDLGGGGEPGGRDVGDLGSELGPERVGHLDGRGDVFGGRVAERVDDRDARCVHAAGTLRGGTQRAAPAGGDRRRSVGDHVLEPARHGCCSHFTRRLTVECQLDRGTRQVVPLDQPPRRCLPSREPAPSPSRGRCRHARHR